METPLEEDLRNMADLHGNAPPLLQSVEICQIVKEKLVVIENEFDWKKELPDALNQIERYGFLHVDVEYVRESDIAAVIYFGLPNRKILAFNMKKWSRDFPGKNKSVTEKLPAVLVDVLRDPNCIIVGSAISRDIEKIFPGVMIHCWVDSQNTIQRTHGLGFFNRPLLDSPGLSHVCYMQRVVFVNYEVIFNPTAEDLSMRRNTSKGLKNMRMTEF